MNPSPLASNAAMKFGSPVAVPISDRNAIRSTPLTKPSPLMSPNRRNSPWGLAERVVVADGPVAVAVEGQAAAADLAGQRRQGVLRRRPASRIGRGPGEPGQGYHGSAVDDGRRRGEGHRRPVTVAGQGERVRRRAGERNLPVKRHLQTGDPRPLGGAIIDLSAHDLRRGREIRLAECAQVELVNGVVAVDVEPGREPRLAGLEIEGLAEQGVVRGVHLVIAVAVPVHPVQPLVGAEDIVVAARAVAIAVERAEWGRNLIGEDGQLTCRPPASRPSPPGPRSRSTSPRSHLRRRQTRL